MTTAMPRARPDAPDEAAQGAAPSDDAPHPKVLLAMTAQPA